MWLFRVTRLKESETLSQAHIMNLSHDLPEENIFMSKNKNARRTSHYELATSSEYSG